MINYIGWFERKHQQSVLVKEKWTHFSRDIRFQIALG